MTPIDEVLSEPVINNISNNFALNLINCNERHKRNDKYMNSFDFDLFFICLVLHVHVTNIKIGDTYVIEAVAEALRIN